MKFQVTLAVVSMLVETQITAVQVRRGCFENGKYFKVGDIISSGQLGYWCFGSLCGESGHIITWDDFNCGSTPTTTPPSTSSSIPSTTPYGCFYNGKFHQPGTEIGKGEDKESNWCYGILCSDTSHILYWDDFNCFTTTSSPTTPNPSTTPATMKSSTTSYTSTSSTMYSSTIATATSVEVISERKKLKSKFLEKLKNILLAYNY